MCRFFFFNDTATTEIYTLSLHDALPIFLVHAEHDSFDFLTLREHVSRPHNALCPGQLGDVDEALNAFLQFHERAVRHEIRDLRSEEHTSELQSRQYLVCRLLLEKKKNLH